MEEPAELEAHWRQTQMGLLADDSAMQPFMEDLRQQLQDKFSILRDKLGFTLDDLQNVPGGEMSLGLIERPGQKAALAITIDISGHEQQAAALLATIEKNFAARGAPKQIVKKNDTSLLVFTFPARRHHGSPVQTVYFLHEGVLCGVDDLSEAKAMLRRFSGKAEDNLRSVPAYQATMAACRNEAQGLEPEVRWYIDPFGLARSIRSLGKSILPRHGKDMIKLLAEQGFDAIRGIGGHVNLLVEGQVEVVHRTKIYAPAVSGKKKDPLRWNLAMRMLQLPNADALTAPPWVPRRSATYATAKFDIQNAFDHIGTLFDAMAGYKDAFQTTLDGMEKDPYGAQVNIRNEFVAFMGEQVTIVTDYRTPIYLDSERSLFMIEATDERKLAKTLAKLMEEEPDVERRDFHGVAIWERIPAGSQIDELQIGAPVLNPLQMVEDEQEEGDEARVLPNSAVCVALGHLMMASDIDFLREILVGFAQRETLANSEDYLQVEALLNRLAPGEKSGWMFSRMDESSRPTYELIRQGKMPEAETLMGKLLNDLLTTDVEKEEGQLRKQRIDGSQLPSFEMVRRYLGPTGLVLRSDPDGWFLTGAMLNKEAP